MSSWRRLAEGGVAGTDRIQSAEDVLSRGEVLAHPTATVYGLGGGTAAADAAVRQLKGAPADRPLLRLAADVATLKASHPELRWTEEADRLASAFWPGPLTLVLDDGGGTGIGVRVESHPVTRAVLEVWGRTMSSTSLNRTGGTPAATAAEAREALDSLPGTDAVPVWWLDAGDLPGGPPSTLLSLRRTPPRLLRAGAVAAQRIEAVLGRELADA